MHKWGMYSYDAAKNSRFGRTNRRRIRYQGLNCMSYALGLNSWGSIYDFHGVTPEDLIKEVQQNYGVAMKQVQRKDMVLGKRYAVFRTSADDFHWARRDEKGHWRHKPGNLPSETISQKDVFSRKWVRFREGSADYCSKLFIFEI